MICSNHLLQFLRPRPRVCGRLVLASTVLVVVPGFLHAQEEPELPSRVPYVVQMRISQLEDLRAAGNLTEENIERLSGPLLAITDDARLKLEIYSVAPVSQAEKTDLLALGVEILGSTSDLQWPDRMSAPADIGLITALVPFDRVEEVSRLPWIAVVRQASQPDQMVGMVETEGVSLHGLEQILEPARQSGIDGSGIRIGVISDGAVSRGVAIQNGELPQISKPAACSWGLIDPQTGALIGDEGTAMLEIIHDMAPGAELVFCSYGNDTLTFVGALLALVEYEADVIIHDIGFLQQPIFQQSSLAILGDRFAELGTSMHAAAGNFGDTHAPRRRAIGSGSGPKGRGLLGPFPPPQQVPGAGDTPCMKTRTIADAVILSEAGATAIPIAVQSNQPLTVSLQWSEPRSTARESWGRGGFTDLNLYVLGPFPDAGCLAESRAVQGDGVGDTIETAQWTNQSPFVQFVWIVVELESVNGAVSPPLYDLQWRNGDALGTSRGGSIAPNQQYIGDAVSVGAVRVPAQGADPDQAWIFDSSSGGAIYFESTTVCAPGSFVAGTARKKGGCKGKSVAGPPGKAFLAPTWVAASGVSVSGAGNFPTPFFGTSAAAPHSAALDALVRQALGNNASPGQIKRMIAEAAIDCTSLGLSDIQMPDDPCIAMGPQHLIGPDNVWGAGVIGHFPDLEVILTAGPEPAPAGVSLTFVVGIENKGPLPFSATGVQAALMIPDGLAVLNVIAPNDASCIQDPDKITCTFDAIPFGEQGVFTVEALVDPDYLTQIGPMLSAMVKVKGAEFDRDMENNEGSVDVMVVSSADVSVTQSASAVSVQPGDPLVYTIEVRNDGPSTAKGIVVTDPLPAPLELLSATPEPAAFNPATNEISWEIEALAPGEVVTLTVNAQVRE